MFSFMWQIDNIATVLVVGCLVLYVLFALLVYAFKSFINMCKRIKQYITTKLKNVELGMDP